MSALWYFRDKMYTLFFQRINILSLCPHLAPKDSVKTKTKQKTHLRTMQAVSIRILFLEKKKKKKKERERERWGWRKEKRRRKEALTLWLSKRSNGYLYAKKSKTGLLTVI